MSTDSEGVKWPALESNPEAMTKYLRAIGVGAPVNCCDVYGFDDELLAFLPRPVYAILFVFPDYRKFDQLYRHVYEDMIKQGATVQPGMFFMKQHIDNACGTFALIHALANNRHQIAIDPNGPLAHFLAGAEPLSPDARSDYLAKQTDMAGAHAECSDGGETENTEHTEHHFLCFTLFNGHVWEIDSRAPVPRARGATTESTFLHDVGVVVREYTQAVDGNISFSAIALVGSASE